MKKHYEGGTVVPITKGNSKVQSSWVPMPNQQNKRAVHSHPILQTGVTNMKSMAEWRVEDRNRRAKETFGRIADRLRARRDGV